MVVLKWLDEHFEEFVLVLCLIMLSTLTSLNVVLRYVFNASLTWSEEVCKLSLILSGFFSISYCVRRGIMIRVDALVELLDERVQLALEIATTALMFLFFGAAFAASIAVVEGIYASGQLSAALRIPVYWIYLVPVFGFFLTVVRLVQRTVERIKETAVSATKNVR